MERPLRSSYEEQDVEVRVPSVPAHGHLKTANFTEVTDDVPHAPPGRAAADEPVEVGGCRVKWLQAVALSRGRLRVAR